MFQHIYILLPVHNRCRVTMRFIACLERQTYKNYTLVVIDDGSKDDTVTCIRKSIPSALVLQGDGSLWWGGSLQKGYQYLVKAAHDNDVVLIANDDIEFDANLLEKILSYLRDRSDCMVSATYFSRQTGELVEKGVIVDWRALSFRQPAAEDKINCLATRCLFMRAATFKKNGGFYPTLLPHYLSDYEFTIRAHQHGIALEFAPDIHIRYDETTTGQQHFEGHGPKEYLKWVFSIKNPINPIYLSSFLLLRCPWRWLPLNLARVWVGFLKRFYKLSF